MTKEVPFRRTLFWIVVAIQMASVLAVIGWRASLLTNGTTILLECRPVDPRSLFSGDYVVLGYKTARVPEDRVDESYKRGQVVYVAMTQSIFSRYWETDRVSSDFEKLSAEYQVVLRGRVDRWRWRPRAVDIRFGIEDFFVPQSEGKKIERSLRDVDVHVEVAVGAAGHAALKRVFIDDREVKFY